MLLNSHFILTKGKKYIHGAKKLSTNTFRANLLPYYNHF